MKTNKKWLKFVISIATVCVVSGILIPTIFMVVKKSNENKIYNITYENTKDVTNNNPTTYTMVTETITLTDLDDTEDYEFLGWYNGETQVTEIVKGSTGNLTLTAKWRDIYKITYENTKGFANGNPTTYTEVTETIVLKNLEDTADFEFLGWYNGEAQVTEIVKGSTGNLTLTAKWRDIYKITYDNTKGFTNDNPTTYTEVTETIVLKNLEDTADFEFLGWYNGEAQVTEIVKGSTGNLTLTAKWRDIYKITYDNTKGFTNDNPTTYTEVTETIVLKNFEDTADFEFAGWYNGETQVTEIVKGSTGNLTLTAKWRDIYKITYEKTRDVTNNNPTTYTVVTETITLNNLDNTDEFEFLGWYNGETQVTEIAKGSTGNLTLTAKWESLYLIIENNVVKGVTEKGAKATKIEIPEGVTSVYETAFYGNNTLQEVILPESLTNIGVNSFYKCKYLRKVTVLSSNLKIEDMAFSDCYRLVEIYNLSNLNIEMGSTNNGCIGENALGIYTSLDEPSKLKISNGVVYYETETEKIAVAPQDKTATTLVLDSDCTKINNYAFYDYEGLCSLTSITIPTGVTSIGELAFAYCKGLTSIALPETITDIGCMAFFDCDKLARINIPKNLTNINDRVFYGSALTKIIIPNNITTIGKEAFRDCSALTKIVIPDSVTSIGESAFKYCYGLVEIVIPGSITSFGKYAFIYCYGLVTVKIGEGLTEIGNEAFRDAGYNSGNVIVIIPNSVTSISDGAFCGAKLDIVYYEGTAEDWGNITIGDNNNPLNSCTRCYYSESAPTKDGNYWHYVDGEATKWEIYKITYENTKDITNDNPTIYTEVTETIVLKNFEDTEDFEFLGWYNGETQVTKIVKGSTGNLTLTAKWRDIYKITYENTKGFTNDNPTTYTEVTETIVLKNLEDTADFEFAGWYNGETQVTEIVKGSTGNLTLTAKWRDIYKITYEKTRDVTNNNPTTYTVVTETITLNNLDNTDEFEFLGWYNGETQVTEIVKGSIGNLTLTAKWESLYLIIENNVVKGVTEKGAKATKIEIPEGVTSVYKIAFYGNNTLQEVILPESLTNIGWNSFFQCRYLRKVTVLSSNLKIEGLAFSGCYRLVEIYNLSNLNIEMGSTNHGYIGENALGIYTSLDEPSKLKISNGVVYYETETEKIAVAPQDKTATTLVLDSDCTKINNYAFYDYEGLCSLTSITIPTGVTSIGEQALSYCKGLTSLVLPETITSIGIGAFTYCSNLVSINIPEKLTSINDSVFYGSALTKIIIPDNITSIDKNAFRACSALTEIVISDSVTSIGESAFMSCDGLLKVKIGNGITEIKYEVFRDAGYISGKATVIIPKSVTSIISGAFYDAKLDIVYYEGTAEDWGNITIGDNNKPLNSCTKYYYSETQPTEDGNYWIYANGEATKWEIYEISYEETRDLTNNNPTTYTVATETITLTDLEDTEDFEFLGWYNGETQVTEIVKGSTGNLTLTAKWKSLYLTIENNVVKGVTEKGAKATKIEIPNYVTSIEEYAFKGCSSLISISMPDSVTSIGMAAFSDCTNLKDITISNGVTSIGYALFNYCSSLTSIVIPNSVTSIEEYAFSECNSLTDVYYMGTAAGLKAISISSYSGLTNATLYSFSYIQPAKSETGNYWHYVDGVATKW